MSTAAALLRRMRDDVMRGSCIDRTKRVRVATHWAMRLALIGNLGCAGAASEMAAPPPLSSAVTLEGARCSLASNKPLAIEWPSEDRGALEARIREGVTAVRFTGCELKIVDRCALARSKYTYSGFTPKHESHTFTTADDLYAQMPVGASRLEASLKSAGQLSLAMTIVGRFDADTKTVRKDDLEGEDCPNATHFVRAVSVGAFALDRGAEASIGGAVAAGQIALGGKSHAKRSALKADGEEQACRQASASDSGPPSGCGAMLRLELVAIDGRVRSAAVYRKEPVCPSGHRWNGSTCSDPSASAPQEASAAGRLLVRGATVFDTATGLTWQRAPSPRRMSWEAAKSYCQSLELDGVGSFRLPKKKELSTLVVESKGSPRIDGDAFPGTPAARFWTFSDDRSSPGDVWAVDFATGQPSSTGSGVELDVRCVR